MPENYHLNQHPAPGNRLVKFCGDTIVFKLTLPHPENGSAWVRTNLGQADLIRSEIIRRVERDETPLGRAWFDIPMRRVDERTFAARLSLSDSGHFEAKCFFLPENQMTPKWPHGPNAVINVDSADSCGANIIYNAFVRQFGPNKSGTDDLADFREMNLSNLDKTGYTVIPPSGTFRDLISELDFIFGELGCRILMLLPIHPTPTTYGRMGRFGSPYAALSFTAVDPALAQFDPHATPLEQFIELIDAVHQRHGKIFIDIAINHTGWAASLHETHPHWLVRNPEGKIEVPGAWGVNWEDLTKLDYTRRDLWLYMADVFLTWCRRGVDGFRCDAGYMIPLEAWKYMIAKVRTQYPDTIFLLEGLGGRISVTRELLNSGNLNWAYSELFQNYDRRQIENYLAEANNISAADGIAVHFAETHDNPRLASRSKIYASMRTALCALFSVRGAFAFANGVEWYATEKINVHHSPSLNWGAEINQVELIRKLNRLLKSHSTFYGEAELNMVQEKDGNYVVLLRRRIETDQSLLIVVNLDDEKQTLASWNSTLSGKDDPNFIDIITESELSVSESDGLHSYLLNPGQVLCLTRNENDLDSVSKAPDCVFRLPWQIETQRLRAKVFQVLQFYNGIRDLGDFDAEQAARQLKADPLSFCKNKNPFSQETRVVTWKWPGDLRREVMIPPDHFLIVQSDSAFRAVILVEERAIATEESLESADGKHFALFAPFETQKSIRKFVLKLSVYSPEGNHHTLSPLLVLPKVEKALVKRNFRRTEILKNDFVFLNTNGRGAMLRIPIPWGKLTSRYDSLLAANISAEFPEDRWIMFTRCRAWLVFQGYSQDLNTNCLEAFTVDDDSGGNWFYKIPTGQGEHVLISLRLKMMVGENAVQLTFCRQPAGTAAGRLDDLKPVQLILRPDIENRNFHETTKAYLGPEEHFPHSVKHDQNEILFTPDAEHRLKIKISKGAFTWEPEWYYMVHRSVDGKRGLDPDSDLFSPGYYTVFLEGGQHVTLAAEINAKSDSADSNMNPLKQSSAVSSASGGSRLKKPIAILYKALEDYLVRRGELKSVIAGYPWFLDWGRDALIFVRGLTAAQKTREVRDILKQFGQFEQQGTLPNMIRGNNAENRDTSDAPLWFILACAELIRAENSTDFLEMDCAGRSIRRIVLSIGQSFMVGTPNGIVMDPESGLVFSPAHFTWMDTDHPAGSPRQGYPIEIQALWHTALGFLASVDRPEKSDRWRLLGQKVQNSIMNLYYHQNLGFLSDCLHAASGQSAAAAAADDALRPNQLLAITLGAVSDNKICRSILSACAELLVPGGIRSLADRPVNHPIEIVHNGNTINDPYHPYQGEYSGDEDTRRKPAYHNGTAWSWPFPSFSEAWEMTYGEEAKETALSWLASGIHLLEKGCLGHIPEIMDGDFPHTPRGCDAQAWGASELLRVLLKLRSEYQSG